MLVDDIGTNVGRRDRYQYWSLISVADIHTIIDRRYQCWSTISIPLLVSDVGTNIGRR